MSDLISRQMAIEVLRNRWLKTRNYEGIGEDIAEECEIYLKTLPSAQPVRHGKWEVSKSGEMCTCSECGAEFDISIGTGCYVDGEELELPKYCLNCGAKMDAERKEE